MDLASQIAGLSTAVTQAFDLVKLLNSADKALDTATLKIQILGITNELVSAKAALSEAQAELSKKDDEIVRLKKAFEDRTTLTEGPEGYKYKSVRGFPDGYPICPACEAKDGRISFLKPYEHRYKGICPTCDKQFHPIKYYINGQEEAQTSTIEVFRVGRSSRFDDF